MKRSLLLINTIGLLLTASCTRKTITVPVTTDSTIIHTHDTVRNTTEEGQLPQRDTVSITPVDKTNTNDDPRAIQHSAPDQHRIDSIKNAKQKGKK